MPSGMEDIGLPSRVSRAVQVPLCALCPQDTLAGWTKREPVDTTSTQAFRLVSKVICAPATLK